MKAEEILHQTESDLYHAQGNLEISERENERLKTELAEVKRFLQELNYSGELKGIWKQRIEIFVK